MSYVNREHGWENFTHVSCRHIAWEGFLCCLLIIATGSERKGMRNDISKMQTDKERKMGYVYHFWQEFSVLCCVRWFRFQESYCIGIDCLKKNSPEIFISVCSISKIPATISYCRWTIQQGVLKLIKALVAHHSFKLRLGKHGLLKNIHTHLQYNCTWKWISFYYSAMYQIHIA